MKKTSYYVVENVEKIKRIPSVKVIKDNCVSVHFCFEADLCVELETNHIKYKSYGVNCPV